jgi:RND family efflux transporter MFP subunit
MKRNKLKFVLIVLAVVIAIGIAVTLRQHSATTTKSETGAPKPALTVEIVHPERASLPQTLTANGNIAAWQEASIGSESNGLQLDQVRVNVGDNVRAGQLLAHFADDSVKADLAQAKATLTEALANETDAVANARRAQHLQASGALSAQQIDQYQTAAATATARVAAARAALDVQALKLRHTRVVAPDDGVIAKRNATEGEVVSAGTELFRMIRQGRLEWRAEVTADELGRIKPGTRARIHAANGAILDGRVRTIAPTVDVQSRIALVYVDLPKTSAALAGMFAEGEFLLGQSEALTLPQQAVVVRDGFAYVFRVDTNQHVTRIKVVTGRRVGERVEMLAGVSADADIVASGAGFLNDGDLVHVVAPAHAADAKVGSKQ